MYYLIYFISCVEKIWLSATRPSLSKIKCKIQNTLYTFIRRSIWKNSLSNV